MKETEEIIAMREDFGRRQKKLMDDFVSDRDDPAMTKKKEDNKKIKIPPPLSNYKSMKRKNLDLFKDYLERIKNGK